MSYDDVFKKTVIFSIILFISSALSAQESFTNSIGMEFVFVAGGEFTRGTYDLYWDEQPLHSVILDGFYIARFEVTMEQYKKIMWRNPSFFYEQRNYNPEVYPVESVNWYGAVAFCNRLSLEEGLKPAYLLEGDRNPSNWGAVPKFRSREWDKIELDLTAEGYRLPTEAEWEYAARGGREYAGSNMMYAGSNNPGTVGYIRGHSSRNTHPVGQRAPNPLGIYDMTGNVAEWCWDWFGSYSENPLSNPAGPDKGEERIIRGGSWNSAESEGHVSFRTSLSPEWTSSSVGFRIVKGQ